MLIQYQWTDTQYEQHICAVQFLKNYLKLFSMLNVMGFVVNWCFLNETGLTI